MQREEAVDTMKEIAASCKFLNPKAIVLEQSRRADHYEIHVVDNVDDESWECLKKLAKKFCLGIKLTDHRLIIYKP